MEAVKINARESVDTMLGMGGKSARSVNELLGRSHNYLYRIRGRDTQVGTLAKIAEVLGLKVAILGKDDEVVAVIEPEAEDGAS